MLFSMENINNLDTVKNQYNVRTNVKKLNCKHL